MATAKLTDKSVTAAKPKGGKRIELWDSEVRGLCLRVSETTKVWVYRYRRKDGSQPRFRLGTYSKTSLPLAEARIQARELRSLIDRGGDPATDKQLQAAEAKAQPVKTVADLADTYFVACSNGDYKPRKKRRKRPKTIEGEQGLWRRHGLAALGGIRVESVSTDAIKKVLRGLVAAGTGVTSNRLRALLRQIFNFAISEGRLQRNPVAQIPAFGDESERERVLTDDEIKTIWTALGDTDGIKDLSGKRLQVSRAVRIALSLAMLTLQRRGEIAGMRLADLDLGRSVWTIPGALTKNHRAHLVPLPERAVELIREAVANAEVREGSSPYVFPGRNDLGKSITPSSLSHALRDLRDALGLADVKLHDFRRTGASLLASERVGVSPVVLGKLLNHISETGGAAAVTQRHYNVHDYGPEKRRALEAWEGLLLKIVGERSAASNVSPMRGTAA